MVREGLSGEEHRSKDLNVVKEATIVSNLVSSLSHCFGCT